MSSRGSNYRSVGLAFVFGCVAIGAALALANSGNDQQRSAQTYNSASGVDEGMIQSAATVAQNSEHAANGKEPELSYQELLRPNGDIDGRRKDYFTADGDDEFGGAVVGMLYDDFRDRLMFAGFSPVRVDPEARCSSGSGFVDCDYTYPETDGCMGTGEAYCSYSWTRNEERFVVTTRDGEGGEVIEMTFIR